MAKGRLSLTIAAVGLAAGAIVLLGSGIGAFADDVPTETLPPNTAARELDRQAAEQQQRADEDYIKQQRGSVLFAFVPLPAVDRVGQPVHDESGNQIMDGSCLIWKSHWVTNNSDVPIAGGKWYRALSFRVDPRARLLQVYELTVPNGVVTANGFRSEPGDALISVNVVVRLEDQPQPGWDCSRETWMSLLTAEDRYIPPTVPAGVPNGGDPYLQKYRERVRQNCLANPQLYHNRC